MRLSGQPVIPASTNTKADSRFYVGINFSPDYCYRILENNGGDNMIDKIIDLREENETPKYSFTTGLSVGYSFAKNFAIEAGLHYSNKGYMAKVELSNLPQGDMVDPRYGFTYAPSEPGPEKIKFVYNHIYLDMPIRVIYNPGKHKLTFLGSLGLTPSVFLTATQTSVFCYGNGDKKISTDDLSYFESEDFMLSAIVSAGVNYRINERFRVAAEPTFRYGLTKITDSDIIAYLWSVGLSLGGYYSF